MPTTRGRLGVPESCREGVAPRGPRSYTRRTWRDRTCPKLVCRLLNNCARARIRPILAICQKRSEFDRIGSKKRPKLARLGQIRLEFDQCWPTWPRCWPNRGHDPSTSDEFFQRCAILGRSVADIGQSWSNLDQASAPGATFQRFTGNAHLAHPQEGIARNLPAASGSLHGLVHDRPLQGRTRPMNR